MSSKSPCDDPGLLLVEVTYQTKARGQQVRRALVAAGRLPGLAGFLANILGRPVEVKPAEPKTAELTVEPDQTGTTTEQYGPGAAGPGMMIGPEMNDPMPQPQPYDLPNKLRALRAIEPRFNP